GCGRRRALLFCCGAFRDALWLRRHDEGERARPLLESPARCLALLAVLALVSAAAALYFPAARGLWIAAPPEARSLVMVRPGGPRSPEVPAMSPAAYRWLAES